MKDSALREKCIKLLSSINHQPVLVASLQVVGENDKGDVLLVVAVKRVDGGGVDRGPGGAEQVVQAEFTIAET